MQNQTAPRSIIRPTDKALKTYQTDRAAKLDQGVLHELGVRMPFRNLLDSTARQFGWTLFDEEQIKLGSRSIRPDGTLRDSFHLRRGYWESKDTSDDLDAEIDKKRAKGYPVTNIIFEDSRRAVLIQNGVEAMRVPDISDSDILAALLNSFFGYVEPDYETFERAVAEFKDQVRDIGIGLQKQLSQAHATNADFQRAFENFYALCRSTLNPNLSSAAVDEMLIQHLLTERLMRKVFDRPDFRTDNAIAREIETVIAQLLKGSFRRDDFQQSLERFYVAIEHAAERLDDFAEKQTFLNTVYERFFQGFSVKVADTLGIVYTPQPIVEFMCASVEEALRTEFGKSLDDAGVVILDPCTGTGNFIVNLIRRLPANGLDTAYRERLFANEVMLLPYYIASLNIEYAFYEKTGKAESFNGLCFVDTLDLAESKQLSFFTERNTERVKREQDAAITVIIGNPPYNANQQNENDNNKNRAYDVIDDHIRTTYVRDGTGTLKNKYYDPYIKFFRWATDRLQGRDGIVCFVTNNSFVDNSLDGLRKHLLRDFTRIYHVDLHGNVRQNPKLSGTTHNVFGIQVGVGITVAIRHSSHADHKLFYVRVPEDWRKGEKLGWLAEKAHIAGIDWQELTPDAKHNWRTAAKTEDFAALMPMGSKTSKAAKKKSSAAAPEVQTIFKTYSLGVVTARDGLVYSFDREKLKATAEMFVELYNTAVDKLKRPDSTVKPESLIDTTDPRIKWSRQTKALLRHLRYSIFDDSYLRHSMYRPFTKEWLYFDDFWLEERYLQYLFFPTPESEQENRAICVVNIGCNKPFHCLMVNMISDYHLTGDSQCFPFYVYDADGTNRRENITDWALAQFREHYGDESITKWDIFYYTYAALHRPEWRSAFAEALKRELPRIALTPSPSPLEGEGSRAADFWAFARAGKQLAELHVNYEAVEAWPLEFVEKAPLPRPLSRETGEGSTPRDSLSPMRWGKGPGIEGNLFRVVDKMRLSKDKTEIAVNPSLTLRGIPASAFEYKLGNRSALEWVIDQYQVKGESDPNRVEDERYIVRLIGQVVRVSVETVEVVRGLGTL